MISRDRLHRSARFPSVVPRLDRDFPLLAGVVTFATYTVTRAMVPTEWDSVQLVMGVSRFDLRQDSPQAPGYYGYVAMGRLIRALTPFGAMRSLTILSALAAAVTVALIAVIGRDLGGRRLGIAAALLLATSPFIWFYGSVVETYPSDALGCVALMVLAWRARPRAWHGIAAAVVLGVTGGFRQTALIVFLPLALTAALRANRTARAWLFSALAGAGAVALWLVPMISEQPGGWSEIAHNDHLYWVQVARRTSVLAGVPRADVTRNFAQLTAYSIAALGLVALLGLAALLVNVIRSDRLAAETPSPTRPELRLTPVELLLIAAVPPFLFIALFHFGKPGYVLSFLVPALLLCLLPVARLQPPWRKLGTVGVAVIALFGAQRFCFGTGVLPDRLVDRGPWFTRSVNGAPFSVTRADIRRVDDEQPVFDQIASRFDPKRDVLVYVVGNGADRFRNAMYALSDFTIHYDDGSNALTGRGNQYEREANYLIAVPKGGHAVFALNAPDAAMSRLEASGAARHVVLPAGPSLWIVSAGTRYRRVTVEAVPHVLDRPIVVRSYELPKVRTSARKR